MGRNMKLETQITMAYRNHRKGLRLLLVGFFKETSAKQITRETYRLIKKNLAAEKFGDHFVVFPLAVTTKSRDDMIGDVSLRVEISLTSTTKFTAPGKIWNLVKKSEFPLRNMTLFINPVFKVFTYAAEEIRYLSKEKNFLIRATTLTGAEKKSLEKLFTALGAQYHYVPFRVTTKKMPGLATDCKPRGKATLFDAVFSDVYCPVRTKLTCNFD